MSSGINNNLPLDKAEIVAFFLESLLFGVAALLYAITIWILIYRRKAERLNKRLVAVSSSMFFFNIVHVGVDMHRILEGFYYQRDKPGGPDAYFAQIWDWSHVFKTGVFVVQTIIADSFAIYRCSVVWNRLWVVIFPSLSLIATLITGIGVVYELAILKQANIFASALTGWITSFFVLTMCTNFVCTSFIAGRIWFTTNKVSRFSGQRSLMPIVIVLVESGALYASSCIALLVTYLLGSNAQYPAVDGAFPIISIAFNLIIVRIALGIAHGGPTVTSTSPTGLTSGGQAGSFGASYGGRSIQYPMKPLAVTVTQLVQQDSDADVDATPVKEGGGESFTTDETVSPGVRKERESWNAV